MENEQVRIDRMRLRVPGLDAECADSLGREVVQHVANGLPAEMRPRRLGALDVRVTIPVGTPRDRLAMVIAEAILRGLV
ncbi:MAG: hypothetical protein JXA33_12490 [Anaerolineae bacterium]|nr:hypothetical protein [Anaerolineae bacterium]